MDFDGLTSIIDDIGGVEINLPRAIDDHLAGGSVPAGKQTINGKKALIVCRSRHSYDDCGDGDSFRAANQRMVISAIAKKILTQNPLTMANTVSKCTKYVTTDIDAETILSLAYQMRNLDTTKNIYSGLSTWRNDKLAIKMSFSVFNGTCLEKIILCGFNANASTCE